MENEAGNANGACHSYLALFIDFSNCRGRGREINSKRTLRSRFCMCTIDDHYDRYSSTCTQLPRFSLFFFLFFFDLRSVNLEPRLKFQRALRPKEEDRRGLDKLSRRRAATNGSSSFGSVSGPKNGKSLLLFCHCARLVYVVIVVLFGRFACRPIIQIQSSWASRFFISVAID